MKTQDHVCNKFFNYIICDQKARTTADVIGWQVLELFHCES